ncbi:hypothetical protein ZMO1_ZMO0931 [Zymomonas mobilis subsp. mobilis ZM4 = ATCC 31821]|uniref:Uncharacterized protein n=2 Tax=Zymomonas mobilis subsp. mobilis TaxID=120045 RepID=Q5NP05_ZYMMO|nr:hypothetical protein [Zymomonas mobilis]AAV89555.1 hypothetical protein ZMO0931 [Zymomonas mobilis subsp. mobilis ZM4 = ATCC 31821]ACV74917.1 hypothetical protein Za10_0366 [Zymomonas mobilis subsp. mobilis NCIMB 11163]AEH62219.1 conserved hypothetical protein [Zymomonas mobilis subsp. mobilis ATCC 10988]AFN56270.1 hypothetical protein ZZ6_0369 [Zymomonas mobilis subsp. mobilis ATCC 29191]ART92873.1 hypothetical protein B9T50_01400 [Zymomonas mobilis subsp. mobilis]
MRHFYTVIGWIKGRLKERTTWGGLLIVVGTLLGHDMGWINNMAQGIGMATFGGTLISFSNQDNKNIQNEGCHD